MKTNRYVLGFATCILSCAVCFAWAGEASALPEVLKDIKPASGICKPETVDVLSGTDFTYDANTEKVDVSCSLSASDLSLMMRADRDMLLVDTRKGADYARFNIAGSMNASVSQIKSKTFLKDKKIILVGDGKVERDLYLSCKELKRANFKDVKVLKGGMLSWITNENPVAGEAITPDQIGVLTPLELWSESRFAGNLFVLDSTQEKFQTELASAELLITLALTNLKKAVEKKSKKHFISSLVIVSNEAFNKADLAKLRKEMFPIPVLAYFDTYENYKNQKSQQEAILLAREHGPKQPGCYL